MSNRRSSEVLNYLLFAATAFGLVLPGSLLPQLLARWALNDRQAGELLFLSFFFSSLGALAARGRLARVAPLGALATGGGLLAMRAASRPGAFLAISLLGLGLGMAMTAISLMQSRRHAAHRSAELSRLNLVWSLGACISPAILLRGAAHSGLDAVLFAGAMGFFLLAMAGWLLLKEIPAAVEVKSPTAARHSSSRRALWAGAALLLVVAMSTGVEASLGGWLTTYSHRAGLRTAGAIDIITGLWIGLLLGRLVQSFRRVATLGEHCVLALAPWLLTAAITGLLVLHQGWSLALCALLAGFALGPMYPLSLALWLEQGERGNLAFLIAGVGSSALPLLTGIVSNATHSLARGLGVPLTGACLMLLAGLTLSRTAANRPERASASSLGV